MARLKNSKDTKTIGSAFVTVLASLLVLAIAASLPARAQTFSVIHAFSGPDGDYPAAGLTMDRGGNFYGTTRSGGSFDNGYYCELYFLNGCGTAFKLTKHVSAWLLAPLVQFDSTNGAYPQTSVTIGPNGTIYGTTGLGGGCGGFGCGEIFNLRPKATEPVAFPPPWTETVLYAFTEGNDGGPYPSELIFDAAGNLYGTSVGGTYGAGNVFEFTPSQYGWTETVLYSFYGGDDGEYPHGMIADSGFNHLYGTTFKGGGNGCGDSGCGTVFELTRSGSGWTETILHTFTDGSDGSWPLAAPIMDQAGNLYGTSSGAYVSPGTVWEMSPSNGGWTFTVLYTFTGGADLGPYGGLAMDAAGNLYGTTYAHGAYGDGNVFKLSPADGGWTYTDLYDFTGGNDGAAPEGRPVVDASSNVYGTATSGGTYGVSGTVWEITP